MADDKERELARAADAGDKQARGRLEHMRTRRDTAAAARPELVATIASRLLTGFAAATSCPSTIPRAILDARKLINDSFDRTDEELREQISVPADDSVLEQQILRQQLVAAARLEPGEDPMDRLRASVATMAQGLPQDQQEEIIAQIVEIGGQIAGVAEEIDPNELRAHLFGTLGDDLDSESVQTNFSP